MADIGGSLNIQRSNTGLLLKAAAIVIVVLAALAGYFAWQYFTKTDAVAEGKETSKRITQKVADIYVVPKDEQPNVAQINDIGKLKSQQFFTSAENGDYVLVYEKAKLALVYREKDDKLVAVGPITTEQPGAGGTQSADKKP